MQAVDGLGSILEERPVVDAPATVVIAVIAIFVAPEIVPEPSLARKQVISHDAIGATMHKNGVVASFPKMLSKGINVVVGVG